MRRGNRELLHVAKRFVLTHKLGSRILILSKREFLSVVLFAVLLLLAGHVETLV
jgi:hypothetical protein